MQENYELKNDVESVEDKVVNDSNQEESFSDDLSEMERSISEFITKNELDATIFENISPETLDKIQRMTLELQNKQQNDASPGAEDFDGLKAFQEKLNAPNASIQDKIKGFLMTLAEFIGSLCASIAGKEYVKAIISLFEGIKAGFQQRCDVFFKPKKDEGMENVLEGKDLTFS